MDSAVQRLLDLKQAKDLYKIHKEYKLYKGWVMIGGVVINGINRKDMEQIEKEINR